MKKIELVRRMNKPDHFLDVYTTLFAPLRDTLLRLLEIGVQQGGSLELWRKYFSNAAIVGLDTNDLIEIPGVEVWQGDQLDKKLLNSLGYFNIIIDDGGHTVEQQLGTLDILYPKLLSGGYYIIEDSSTYPGTLLAIKEKVHEIGNYYSSIQFLDDLIILKKI